MYHRDFKQLIHTWPGSHCGPLGQPLRAAWS